MKESTLQRNAIKYLRDHGAYVFNVVGGASQQRGTADLLICYRGLFIATELKVPGKKPSKIQEYELEKVRKAGGKAGAVESMEELETLLNESIILAQIQNYTKNG